MTSKLDMCDVCDNEEPLDLLELTLDMACPPWGTEVTVLEFQVFWMS